MPGFPNYPRGALRAPSRALGWMALGMTLAGVLGGCSFGGDHSDLRNYIAEVKSRPRGAIEPLPPLRTYDAYVYNVTAMRSPFERPIESREVVRQGDPKVRPIAGREREYLESFGLDSLKLVGSLQQQDKFYALIKDAQGTINRVTVGNYLGRDHGKIVAATPTQVDIVEIVSDGLGGWLQRPRTLTLSEKE